MTNRKALPADIADKFFKGESVFFEEQPQAEKPGATQSKPETPLLTDQESHPDGTKQSQLEELMSAHQDVMIDVTTSLLQDVDLKQWREMIEDTETQNSSLRLTSEERYVIEDIISELQRKERIKTSMNEVARLGLLFLIHEFKQNRRTSILYRVK